MNINFHQLILNFVAKTIGEKLENANVTIKENHATILLNESTTVFSVNKPTIEQIHITFVNPAVEIKDFIKKGGLKISYTDVEEDFNLHLAIRKTSIFFNDNFITNEFIDWEEPIEITIALDMLVFLRLIDYQYEILGYDTDVDSVRLKVIYNKKYVFIIAMKVENSKYSFQLIVDVDKNPELIPFSEDYEKISNDILLLTAHINKYYSVEES